MYTIRTFKHIFVLLAVIIYCSYHYL